MAEQPTLLLGGELPIGRLGFGAMRAHGEAGARVLRRALELGVTFVDTADGYGPHTGELLLTEALHPYPDGLVSGTEAGIDKVSGPRVRDGRLEYLCACCKWSLRRLRLDRLDLFSLRRAQAVAPVLVPIPGTSSGAHLEESMRALV